MSSFLSISICSSKFDDASSAKADKMYFAIPNIEGQFVANQISKYSRKEIDDITKLAVSFGAKALANIIYNEDGTAKSPVLKFVTEEQAKALADLLEKIRTHKGISKADLDRLPNKNRSIYEELEAELNANITHVGKTYSGIELVHFCRNNEHDEVLKGLGLTRKFGEIVFWHFLVPKILEARKLIGIEYLFLFAADMTQDNLLVKYYNKLLKFKLDEERATVKPVYDFSCKFMYQPIDGMEDAMSAFWANYMTDDEV